MAMAGGEAHRGDVAGVGKVLHRDLPDRRERILGSPAAFKLAHDGRDHLLDSLRIDRALAQGDLHRAHQFVAIERYPAAVALDHRELAQLHPLKGGEAEIAGDANPPPPDHCGILGWTRVLYPRIETVAAGTSHPANTLLIDWETVGERPHPFLDRGFHQRRLAVLRLRDRIEHFGNQAGDLLEFGNPKTARGCSRRPQTKTGRDEWRPGVERNAVLVAGDRRAHQCLFRDIPLETFGRRSTSIRWLSVPPETMSRPLARSDSASAL